MNMTLKFGLLDNKMRLIAVDPSIRACGYAVFSLGRGGYVLTSQYGVFTVPADKEFSWRARLHFILQQLNNLFQSYKGSVLVLEMPDHLKAGIKERDMYKLAYLCGAIEMSAFVNKLSTTLIEPHEWKGSMKKEITTKRVNKTFGLAFRANTIEHNIADAIALGTWFCEQYKLELQGLFKS